MSNKELTKQNDDDLHVITAFSSVDDASNGVRDEFTLNDIHNLFEDYVEESVHIVESNKDKLNKIKREDLHVITYADLTNNYRSNNSFISRSLLCLDIDYKPEHENIVLYDDMVGHLKKLNIDSILYTSLQHTTSIPRYRIIVNVGRLCDPTEFVNWSKWFASTLPCQENAIDGKSWTLTQCMIVPCAYRFEKPRLDRIEGKSLYELFDTEYKTYVANLPVAISKGTNSNKKSCGSVSNSAEDAFIKQVSFLHKPLILHDFTNTSVQFYRNSNDNNAGLFCLNEGLVIHDQSKNEHHSLFYSLNDYAEAINHKLPTRESVANDMLSWESDETMRTAVLLENCGSGKSQSILKLANLNDSNIIRIFTFHTRDARDSFHHHQTNDCMKIYGNIELIEHVVQNHTKIKNINKFLKKYYEDIAIESKKGKKLIGSGVKWKESIGKKHLEELDNEMYFNTVLDELINNSLITKIDKKDISKLVKDNRNNIHCGSHLIMTTAKLEFTVSFSDEDAFNDYVVYTDEVKAGMLTHIPDNTKVLVYRTCDQEIESETALDYEKLRSLKRCFLTVEKVIIHELNKLSMPFQQISNPSKTYDENLEVLIVPTTSNKPTKDSRKLIFDTIRSSFDKSTPIIVDGIKDEDNTYNHTNSKGINSLRKGNVIDIIAYPSPTELALTMYVTGLDERSAIQLIMSDKATQSIGRNSGYRNIDENGVPSKGDNHNLLIIPEKVDFDIHNVTSKVVRSSQWNGSGRKNSLSIKDRQSFYFSNLIDNICNVTKSSNSPVKQPIEDQRASVLYVMFSKFSEFGAKRFSLTELGDETGIKKSIIKKLFGSDYHIGRSRPWNKTTRSDCIYFR